MKDKDPLKELMEKRYLEEQAKQKEVSEQKSTKVGEKTTIYAPYKVGSSYYLCKLELSLDITESSVVSSSVELISVVPFVQKVVAKVHNERQDNALKHYYEMAKNKEMLK